MRKALLDRVFGAINVEKEARLPWGLISLYLMHPGQCTRRRKKEEANSRIEVVDFDSPVILC
jgi:hypothetical protein